MSTCRKCGFENATTAKFCQMCASAMPVAGATGSEGAAKISNSSLSPTVVMSAEPSAEPQICPVCDAANEGSWAFCQQCGSNLGGGSNPVQSPVEPSDEAEAEVRSRRQTYATTIQASHLGDRLKKASSAAHANCPKCSQSVVTGAEFCHKCGAAMTRAKTVAMSSVKPAAKPRLLLMVDGEATGDEFEIKGETVIGRIDGDITFPHDDYMSGRHGRITKRGDKFILIDEDSRNGSFIRIRKEVEIKPGDSILLGKQLFRFEL
jgi:ribosomal protein L40E